MITLIFFSPGVCHIFISGFSSAFTLNASTYNLTFLIIERQLAIINPLQYDTGKVMKRLPFVFLVVWLFSAAAWVIVPATTAIKYHFCFVIFHIYYTFVWEHYFSPHVIVVTVVLPVVIMVVCYIRMFIALKKSLNLMKESSLRGN